MLHTVCDGSGIANGVAKDLWMAQWVEASLLDWWQRLLQGRLQQRLD